MNEQTSSTNNDRAFNQAVEDLNPVLNDTQNGLRFLATMIGHHHAGMDDLDHKGIAASLRAFADKLGTCQVGV